MCQKGMGPWTRKWNGCRPAAPRGRAARRGEHSQHRRWTFADPPLNRSEDDWKSGHTTPRWRFSPRRRPTGPCWPASIGRCPLWSAMRYDRSWPVSDSWPKRVNRPWAALLQSQRH